jgi:SAM-dependent methyltransferase
MTDHADCRDDRIESGGLLDVRSAAEFEEHHLCGAVNIPLEELAGRMHELPSRGEAVSIYDADSVRARWAASRLRARGRAVAAIRHGLEWLREGSVESGPSRGRLWRPHGLVVEAMAVARRTWGGLERRRALDMACGSGRDAVFMAMEGLAVDGWDLLPDALERCRDLAGRCGVEVATRCVDLESGSLVVPERFDLICCFSYLHRPLMPMLAEAVRPGGLIVYETFVDPQREVFGKPSREAHVLRAGELLSWFGGWDVLVWREGLAAPRRFVAAIIARRP